MTDLHRDFQIGLGGPEGLQAARPAVAEKKRKKPTGSTRGLFRVFVPATTYFPRKPSIIGSVGLNCGVRNGNRCDPDDMITRTSLQTEMRFRTMPPYARYDQVERQISTGQLHVLPRVHLQPIDLLVSKVSSGRSHLEVGFPLRCIQRLSLPKIATQHCTWRHN